MSDDIFHIPTNVEEDGFTSGGKTLFFVPCAICKQKYEVRSGDWLTVKTGKGTALKIKVCNSCFTNEMNETSTNKV